MVAGGQRPNVQAVLDARACSGCGACTVVCPRSSIEMIHGERFNFPRITAAACTGCGSCLEVCPSAFLLEGTDPGHPQDPAVLGAESCLAHSTQEDVRIDATSGGFVTGLILDLMERGAVDGALVVRGDPDRPLESQSFVATDRDALLASRGSRYGPASTCAALVDLRHRAGNYVFVGTPCMIDGLSRLEQRVEVLKERIVLTIGLVCGGMASRRSTVAQLVQMGIRPSEVRRIAYRGGGWPGSFRVHGPDGLLGERPLMPDAIQYVGRDLYLRCWNCLDRFARFADLSVSDPWCERMLESERKGRTAVLARTERGKRAVREVAASGALVVDAIGIDEMLGYNRPFLIDRDHRLHGWMASYQILFFRRWRYAKVLLRHLSRGNRSGLKTTFEAKLDRSYYV